MSQAAVFEEAVLHGFIEELSKIAAEIQTDIPLVKMAQFDPEALEQMLKEAGIFSGLTSRLGQYGKNISAYAQQAKDSLTGGAFAKQMRELGSTSPMTSSASKASLAPTMGPMREQAHAAALAAQEKAMLRPEAFGLTSAPRPVGLPHVEAARLFGPQPARPAAPSRMVGAGRVIPLSQAQSLPELQAASANPGFRAARRGTIPGGYNSGAAEAELSSLFGAPFTGRYST